MKKIDFIKDQQIDTAPAELKEELMSLLSEFPDELSEGDVQKISLYFLAVQAREQELASAYTKVADSLEQFADETERNQTLEDDQVNAILRDSLEKVQNLVT